MSNRGAFRSGLMLLCSLAATAHANVPRRSQVVPVTAPFRPWLSGSGVAVDPRSGDVLLAESDNGTLVVARGDGSAVIRTVVLGGAPEQVVCGPDGRAWVSLRESGEVALVEPGAATPSRRLHVGAEPFGLALSPERSTLYVALGGGGAVLALDAATLQPRERYRVDANPRGVGLSPDGNTLLVAHLIGRSLSAIHLGGAIAADHAVERLPLAPPAPSSLAARPAPTMAPNLTYAVGFAPAGDRIVAPHVLEDSQAGGNLGGGGGGYGGSAGGTTPIVASLSLVDAKALALDGQWLAERFSDFDEGGELVAGLSQPRALAFDPARSRVFVAALGSDEVKIFSIAGDRPVPLGAVRTGFRSGPTGLAVSADGSRLYVRTLLDHRLVVADVGGRGMPRRPVARLSVGVETMPTAAAHGRALFYGAGNLNISGSGQLTCGSCHPEGRHDGQVWSVDEGPRRTLALADRLTGTGPYNWQGQNKSLEVHIQHTMRQRLGGAGLDKKDMADLVTWLTGFCHLPPRPAAPTLTALEQRGKELFHSDEVGCADCHDAARQFRDGRGHDIGTATPAERKLRLAAIERDFPPFPVPRPLAPPRNGPTPSDRAARLEQEVDLLLGISITGPIPAEAARLQQEELARKFEVERRWKERAALIERRREQQERRQLAAARTAPMPFDTPSLVAIAFAGPYFHDGSAATLRDVLTTANRGDRMGHTSHLGPGEIDALVAYLGTL